MQPLLLKALFLDIGGVLLTNGWGHESRQKAAAHFEFDYDEMNLLHEFIFNIYEIGKISLDEYLNTVLFYQPRAFTKEDFKTFMFSESRQLPHTLEWLVDWKRQQGDVKIISINNEGRELNDYRIKKFGLHRCFDAFVAPISHLVFSLVGFTKSTWKVTWSLSLEPSLRTFAGSL